MTRAWLWRSLILVFLGVFLRSIGQLADEFHFRGHAQPDRPGLHVSVRAGFFSARVQWIALGGDPASVTGRRSRAIRLPASDFDFAKVGVPRELAAPS